MTFAHILKEIRYRFSWCFICFCCSCICCYIFSEELVFLLAKPFLNVCGPNKSFISTQLTETLNTYIVTSFIFSFVFCIPYFLYQLWCFFIPSVNQTQRILWYRLLFLSAFMFVCVISISELFILPNILVFLYNLSDTSTSLLVIQFQPKIYDFIIITLRFLFLSSICSQIPVIILCLIEYNIIKIQDCIKRRNFLLFCCINISALLTPPDFWCQLNGVCLIIIIIECSFVYALIRFHYEQFCFQKRKKD